MSGCGSSSPAPPPSVLPTAQASHVRLVYGKKNTTAEVPNLTLDALHAIALGNFHNVDPESIGFFAATGSGEISALESQVDLDYLNYVVGRGAELEILVLSLTSARAASASPLLPPGHLYKVSAVTAQLEDELAAAVAERDALACDRETAANERDVAIVRVSELEAALHAAEDAARDEMASLREVIDMQRAEVAELRRVVAQHQSEAASLRNIIANVAQVQTEREETVARLEAELAEARAAAATEPALPSPTTMAAQAEQLEARRAALEKEKVALDRKRAAVNQLQTSLASECKRVADLERVMLARDAELTTREEALEEREAAAAALEAELQAQENDLALRAKECETARAAFEHQRAAEYKALNEAKLRITEEASRQSAKTEAACKEALARTKAEISERRRQFDQYAREVSASAAASSESSDMARAQIESLEVACAAQRAATNQLREENAALRAQLDECRARLAVDADADADDSESELSISVASSIGVASSTASTHNADVSDVEEVTVADTLAVDASIAESIADIASSFEMVKASDLPETGPAQKPTGWLSSFFYYDAAEPETGDVSSPAAAAAAEAVAVLAASTTSTTSAASSDGAVDGSPAESFVEVDADVDASLQ